jgi:O-glycosyl hydrolase
MNKLAIIQLTLMVALLAGCSDEFSHEGPGAHSDVAWGDVVPAEADQVYETGVPAADEVRFNDSVRFQKLDGVGANAYAFPFANDQGWSWESVKSVFDDLDLHYIRLASWFEFWEPEPGAFDASGIIGSHDVGFAKFLAEKGIDVELGVWNVSDWMLSSESPRRIAPARYGDLGRSIAAYYTNMKENGVPMSVAEVQNEPGIQARIIYDTPEDLREAALAVVEQLDAEGHEDVMLHGPNWHAPNEAAADAAEVWFADEKLAERTAALSFHTWWVDDFESYDRLRRIAEAHDKPVWATEVGFCALPNGCGNGHFLLPETWETAWDYAMSFYRALEWARAERVYHWAVVGHDALLDPESGAPTPSLHVVKHFANFISPGSRMIDTASGDSEVLSLGFLHPNGERTLILLNTSAEPKSLLLSEVTGTSTPIIEALTSTNGSYGAMTAMVAGDEGPRVSLPAESVTSLRF